jgi:hypothetical protein
MAPLSRRTLALVALPDRQLADRAVQPASLALADALNVAIGSKSLIADAPRSWCHHPRKRVIQYSEASVTESKRRGVRYPACAGYDRL